MVPKTALKNVIRAQVSVLGTPKITRETLLWPTLKRSALVKKQMLDRHIFEEVPNNEMTHYFISYDRYFVDKTFKAFTPIPITAQYFIVLIKIVVGLFRLINTHLNHHFPTVSCSELNLRINLIR